MKTRNLIALTLAVFLLAACGPSAAEQEAAVQTQVALLQASQQQTEAAIQASQPTAAPVATEAGIEPTNNTLIPPLPAEANCTPDSTQRVLATVTDVWSGDSIQVNINGQTFEVRYIGIDSGDLPADANRQLVDGKQVVLVTDTTEADEYGRLPRYVIADGVFVNLQLLRTGAAFLSLEAPDLACEQVFKDANPLQ